MNPAVREKIDLYLKKKGLRRTSQREVIFEAALDTQEHYTAEDLLQKVQAIDRTTSRATVYRTLSLLVEGGLLREVDLGDNLKSYDPNFLEHPNHNHLICQDCRRVLEFEDTHINVLEDCITRRLGYIPVRKVVRIEAHCETLERTGVCEHLAAASRNA